MEKTNWIYSLSGANRKSKIQNPKWGGLVAFVVAFAICGAAVHAQPAKKVQRIGFLGSFGYSMVMFFPST